jgi:hypothetical protein
MAVDIEAGFLLTDEEEDEFEAALAEIDAGFYTDGDEVLREIRALTCR